MTTKNKTIIERKPLNSSIYSHKVKLSEIYTYFENELLLRYFEEILSEGGCVTFSFFSEKQAMKLYAALTQVKNPYRSLQFYIYKNKIFFFVCTVDKYYKEGGAYRKEFIITPKYGKMTQIISFLSPTELFNIDLEKLYNDEFVFASNFLTIVPNGSLKASQHTGIKYHSFLEMKEEVLAASEECLNSASKVYDCSHITCLIYDEIGIGQLYSALIAEEEERRTKAGANESINKSIKGQKSEDHWGDCGCDCDHETEGDSGNDDYNNNDDDDEYDLEMDCE